MRLNIAKHIYAVLSTDTTVNSYVNGTLFPVATKVEKAFPLILYERDSAVSHYTKDGPADMETTATVFVVTEDYSQGVTIAEAVIAALERKEAHYDELDVVDCVHVGSVEGFQDRSFIQQIQFNFITIIN